MSNSLKKYSLIIPTRSSGMSSQKIPLVFSDNLYYLNDVPVVFRMECTKPDMTIYGYHDMILDSDLSIAGVLVNLLTEPHSIGNYSIGKLDDCLRFIKVGQIEGSSNQTIFIKYNTVSKEVRVIVMSVGSPVFPILGSLVIKSLYRQCPIYYNYNCQKYADFLANEEFIDNYFKLKGECLLLDQMNIELDTKSIEINKEFIDISAELVLNQILVDKEIKIQDEMMTNAVSKFNIVDEEIKVLDELIQFNGGEDLVCDLRLNLVSFRNQVMDEIAKIDEWFSDLLLQKNNISKELDRCGPKHELFNFNLQLDRTIIACRQKALKDDANKLNTIVRQDGK